MCPPKKVLLVHSQLPAGDGSDDEKRFLPRDDRRGQRGIRGLEGKVFLAGEETQEWPALLSDMIADRSAQHGKTFLERVENGTLGDRPFNIELNLSGDMRQCAQMKWEHDTDHGRI